MMLLDLLKALKMGEELKNPAAWKNAQVLTNIIGGIIALVLKYLPAGYQLPDDIMSLFVSAIVGIVIAVNSYITYASSKKVGL